MGLTTYRCGSFGRILGSFSSTRPTIGLKQSKIQTLPEAIP